VNKLLSKIQRELKAPKSNFNSFGKYSYRSCEDILEAVKPLLGGAALTLSDEMVEVGGRVYVKATATLIAGETISVTAFAREPDSRKGMDLSQITGTASSYARKYALNGLFCIDDTKDADTMNNSQTTTNAVMDDEAFHKNLPTYTKMIKSGAKSASELINFLSSKKELTPGQCETLNKIKVSEVMDAEVVNG